MYRLATMRPNRRMDRQTDIIMMSMAFHTACSLRSAK